MSENNVTVLARLSYVHVFEPDSIGGQTEPKYSLAALLPKSDAKTIDKVRAAIKATVDVDRAGKQVLPKTFRLSASNQPLHDGDEEVGGRDAKYPGLDVCYFNAKSSERPVIVDKSRAPIMDPDQIYSGCWAWVNVSFFAYNKNGNAGIGCALNGVMKAKDDERLDARQSAEQMFGGITDDPFRCAKDDDDWMS